MQFPAQRRSLPPSGSASPAIPMSTSAGCSGTDSGIEPKCPRSAGLLLFCTISFYVLLFLIRVQFPQFKTLEQYSATPAAGLLIAAALLLFLWGVTLAERLPWRVLAGGYSALAGLMVLTPPLLSGDIHLYGLQGRVLGVYG